MHLKLAYLVVNIVIPYTVHKKDVQINNSTLVQSKNFLGDTYIGTNWNHYDILILQLEKL